MLPFFQTLLCSLIHLKIISFDNRIKSLEVSPKQKRSTLKTSFRETEFLKMVVQILGIMRDDLDTCPLFPQSLVQSENLSFFFHDLNILGLIMGLGRRLSINFQNF